MLRPVHYLWQIQHVDYSACLLARSDFAIVPVWKKRSWNLSSPSTRRSSLNAKTGQAASLQREAHSIDVESALIEVMGFRRDSKKLFVVGRTDRGDSLRLEDRPVRAISQRHFREFTAFSNDGQSQHRRR